MKGSLIMNTKHTKATVAVIGCGAFSPFFIPLFKAHPYTEKVYVCDLVPEKAQTCSEKFGVDIIDTFEEAVSRDDITAVAIFTERHTHGPLVKKALMAGKDVYSAVPMASDVDECLEIVDAVKKTGLIYMMGETCVYYPCAMFCKREHKRGTFGDFVYGESQYFHDLSHFGEKYRNSPDGAGLPPFFYPTHSTAMILDAADDYVTEVCGFGYKDTNGNEFLKKENNSYGNEFSNEFCMMRLSKGGIARVAECRSIGYKAPSSYISGFYGTKGAYQFSNAQHLVTTLTEKGVDLRDVSDEVNSKATTALKYELGNSEDFKRQTANHVNQWRSPSPQQEENYKSIPGEFDGLANGHMASHQLLINDFMTAVYEREQPYVDAVRSARYTVPGLIAHKSAMMGSVNLKVPYIGW